MMLVQLCILSDKTNIVILNQLQQLACYGLTIKVHSENLPKKTKVFLISHSFHFNRCLAVVKCLQDEIRTPGIKHMAYTKKSVYKKHQAVVTIKVIF